SRSDPVLRFVRSRQGFVRRCYGTEKAPTIKGRGKVGRTARSKIRPFPICIIALSRNASCLHLSFNYSQRAFFLTRPAASRDLFIRAKDLFVEATASPQTWIPCLPPPRRR